MKFLLYGRGSDEAHASPPRYAHSAVMYDGFDSSQFKMLKLLVSEPVQTKLAGTLSTVHSGGGKHRDPKQTFCM